MSKQSNNLNVLFQPKIEKEKHKLHDMTLKGKISYLWCYYKLHAFFTIAGVALLIAIIHTIVTPKIKMELSVAMINNIIDTEDIKQIETDFGKHINLNPKTEELRLNTTFMFNGSYDFAANARQILTTYIFAREIDVIIAPESELAHYAYYGSLSDLADQLPTDLYSSLTDRFFISDQEENPDKNAFGIYLTDTKTYKDYIGYAEPFVLGIVINSKNKENSIEFIRYLFDIYP